MGATYMRWLHRLMCKGGWHIWAAHIYLDVDAREIVGIFTCDYCPATKAYEDGY
jgi:hypothetical protein